MTEILTACVNSVRWCPEDSADSFGFTSAVAACRDGGREERDSGTNTHRLWGSSGIWGFCQDDGPLLVAISIAAPRSTRMGPYFWEMPIRDIGCLVGMFRI